MPCSWQKDDYFSLLMSSDKRSHSALEMLVDDLHADKEKTVNAFLSHSGSEDFLWGLVRLLGNDTARVAGNAAYILGTLAEAEVGCMRVLSLVRYGSNESKKILPDLTRMLTFDDSESVMNAAGTMGTLAESHEGREWILREACLPQTLDHVTALLHSENLWTASNAALVLARLSISEYGCQRMLDHEHSQHILSKLILSLGVDEAGRGMNAAFAIGRLCDMDQGRKRLLQLSDSERMISSLAKMLSCNDTGASKNACFALSCLATNSEGHSRLLGNIHSEEILRTLSGLLNADDAETGWFAAMTLRTLASQPKGCLRLRDHPQVVPSLKSIEVKDEVNADLKEEAIITLEILKRLPKPSPPTIIVLSSNSLKASWDPINTKSGFQVRYQLFDGTKCVYTGKQCECEVTGLQPNTAYVYKLRAYTEGDESPFSDPVSIITEEAVPGPPQSVRILGATITQLKVGWDPPADTNGFLKGYYVFVDDKEVQHTQENSVILTGLTANTTYDVSVCAVTSKGRGEKNGTTGTTSEIGAHAPSKPHVNVIGRNELYVSWGPPEVPLGRLNRYDVIMNDKIIYSGNDLNLPVRRLVPDTEYSFVIVALTSEGKFESKMTKKRTAKDEYDQARPPLYQPPKKENTEETIKTQSGPPVQKRRKSSARVSSAKNSAKRRERVKSSSSAGQEPRPSSAASNEAQETAPAEEKRSDTPPEPPPKPPSPPQPAEPTHVPRLTPSPSVGKPIAEVKYEAPKPISKPKTPRGGSRVLDRTPPSAKPQPVALSTVSMQNTNKAQSSANDNRPLEANITGKRIGAKTDKDLPALGNSHPLKMERSKTTISGRELRKGKYSMNSAQKADSVEKSQENLDKERPDSFKSVTEKCSPILNDKDQSVTVTKENRKSKLSEDGVVLGAKDKELSVQNGGREKSSRAHARHDRARGRDTLKSGKEANLPKPAPPSQKYLEGPVQGDPSPWGHKMAPSPRSSKDGSQDSEWLTHVKSVSETFSRPFVPTNATPHHADSTYFIDDASQFLQRTNTYIASHRPGGRRSLEKLQKASPGVKVTMPSKLSQSINFDIDIPDHSSKLANKFIPMQLRTQPSNLGIGQLQRVNTTLLGDLTGDNSISFRRVEALTRAHTQADLKSQFSIPAENRRDLMLPINKDKDRTGRKLSGSPGKSHKLGGSALGPHHRPKEPDSMLLQQSWGLNSSPDLAALQNVR